MNFSINLTEIKNSYYYTDIKPNLEAFNQIIRICEDFEKDGGDKLAYALSQRHWDLNEIERMNCYLMQTRHKMKEEVKRIEKIANTFNEEFATDHNKLFDPVQNRAERLDLSQRIDCLNQKYGLKTVSLGVEGEKQQPWEVKSEHKSYNYLTDINEILTIRIRKL